METWQVAHIKRVDLDIDLGAFVISKGYVADERNGSVCSLVLQHASGDKLIVFRARNGQWRYRSIWNVRDSGTIFDFIRTRERKSLEQALPELWDWLGKLTRRRSIRRSLRNKRHAAVLRVARAIDVPTHPYLEARGLSQETLLDPRFRGTWKQDAGSSGDVLFPRRDVYGLCSVEVPGCERVATPIGIWQSASQPDDIRLVVTESPIEAMSYHQLRPDERTRYVSVGRQLRDSTLRDLMQAVAPLEGRPATLIAATSNDQRGHIVAQLLEPVATIPGLAFRREHPPSTTWNEALQSTAARAAVDPG